MQILIFGANGMFGHKLYQRLSEDFGVVATLRGGFDTVERFGIFDKDSIIEYIDVTNRTAVEHAIETARPDCVINAVGIIKQAPESANIAQMLAVNSIFPHILAELAAKYSFRLISISTDCVFSGLMGNYCEADIPDARDLYGMSKLLGEVAGGGVLTLRTSIIGRELDTTQSIVEWFLSNRGGDVAGYTEAMYTGFPSIVLADIIADLIKDHADLNGIYHVSSDPISKFDLLTLLNKYYDSNVAIRPDDSIVIDRSLDSSLFRRQTGFMPVIWEKMIVEMAADTTDYDGLRDIKSRGAAISEIGEE